MRTDELVTGRNYAFRHTRGPDAELLKARLLDMVGRKGKIKVRFETGPHPGLEEYVATRQLVARRSERRALLRDEQREQRQREYAHTMRDGALVEAASAVLTATGEPGGGADPAVTVFSRAELQRILDRAGLDTAPEQLHWLAYRDRHDRIHLPLDAVVMVARAFAAAEPDTVAAYLEDEETQLRRMGNTPGERWYHDYLREKTPGSRSRNSGPAPSSRPRCSARRSRDCERSCRTRPSNSGASAPSEAPNAWSGGCVAADAYGVFAQVGVQAIRASLGTNSEDLTVALASTQ